MAMFAIYCHWLCMTTMNISLPAPLREFVETQLSEGGYASASEYMRELIRDARPRSS